MSNKQIWMQLFSAAITGCSMRTNQLQLIIEESAAIADLAFDEYEYRDANGGRSRKK